MMFCDETLLLTLGMMLSVAMPAAEGARSALYGAAGDWHDIVVVSAGAAPDASTVAQTIALVVTVACFAIASVAVIFYIADIFDRTKVPALESQGGLHWGLTLGCYFLGVAFALAATVAPSTGWVPPICIASVGAAGAAALTVTRLNWALRQPQSNGGLVDSGARRILFSLAMSLMWISLPVLLFGLLFTIAIVKLWWQCAILAGVFPWFCWRVLHRMQDHFVRGKLLVLALPR